MGCQQAWTKCQISGPEPSLWKRTREEESLEEGLSKRARGGWVRRLQDRDHEGGGVDLAPFLEGI